MRNIVGSVYGKISGIGELSVLEIFREQYNEPLEDLSWDCHGWK